jgi:dynein heavy chain 2
MEAARLEANLRIAQETLEQASELLGQLSGENDRWKTQVKSLELEMSLVPIRSLISSGYLTYMGSQNETVREKTLMEWCSALKMQDFNFRTFLSSET